MQGQMKKVIQKKEWRVWAGELGKGFVDEEHSYRCAQLNRLLTEDLPVAQPNISQREDWRPKENPEMRRWGPAKPQESQSRKMRPTKQLIVFLNKIS